jgi:hypothetical protein
MYQIGGSEEEDLQTIIKICNNNNFKLSEKNDIWLEDVNSILIKLNKLLDETLKDSFYKLQLIFDADKKINYNEKVCYMTNNKKENKPILGKLPQGAIELEPILCNDRNGIWIFTNKEKNKKIKIKGLGNPTRIIQKGHTNIHHTESLIHHIYMQLLLWSKIFKELKENKKLYKKISEYIYCIPIALVFSDSTKCGETFFLSKEGKPIHYSHAKDMKNILKRNMNPKDLGEQLIINLVENHMNFHKAIENEQHLKIIINKKKVPFFGNYFNNTFDNIMLNIYAVLFQYCDTNGRFSLSENIQSNPI